MIEILRIDKALNRKSREHSSRLVGVFLFFIVASIFGCSSGIPEQYVVEHRQPTIYPDYASVVIPPNIAPLNFLIEEPGDAFLTRISGEQGEPILVHGSNVDIPLGRWKKLLAANRNQEIRSEIFVRSGKIWKKFTPVLQRVAEEPIDGWITYRLLEPVFDQYREISIGQRNIESFEERLLYNNQRMVGDAGQCANCHTVQNRLSENMLFHTRGFEGGTVFVKNGTAEKIDLGTEATLSAATYPSWHPTLNIVAFSVNVTSQHFHTVSPGKVEVLDIASDLVLYDVDKNELSYILWSVNEMETYPSWSQDGRWLYYCNAKLNLPSPDIEIRRAAGMDKYRDFKYDLMRIPFDPETKRFGKPEMLVDAAAMSKSITFPRPSPDGRFIMYCLIDYGNFSIWHRESDLWIYNTETKESRPLAEANSPDTESFHNWSSDGRWFVFSSRREDGLYTRLYFSHIDDRGRASKPFLLPQRRPEKNRELLKSYNVPEIMQQPADVRAATIMKVVQGKPCKKAAYRSNEAIESPNP